MGLPNSRGVSLRSSGVKGMCPFPTWDPRVPTATDPWLSPFLPHAHALQAEGSNKTDVNDLRPRQTYFVFRASASDLWPGWDLGLGRHWIVMPGALKGSTERGLV